MDLLGELGAWVNLNLLCLIHSEWLQKCQVEPSGELMISRDEFQWGDLEPRNAQSSSTLSLPHPGAANPPWQPWGCALGSEEGHPRDPQPEGPDLSFSNTQHSDASESLTEYNYITWFETKQKP